MAGCFVRLVQVLVILGAMLFALPAAGAQEGEGEDKKPERLGVVEVNDEAEEADDGYVSKARPKVGRRELPVEETPRAIQVFNQEVIRDQKPRTIEEVVTQSSNVVFQGDNDGRENSFSVRGFSGAPVLRDGFRVETFGQVADPEIWGMESAEVQKGPDSIAYGESNPGGLINLVSKRPQKDAHFQTALDFGSFGSVSPKIDVGGPIDGGGDVRYRFLSLYAYDEGWKDFDNPNQRYYIAPSVAISLSKNTDLTLVTEVTRDDMQADFGTAINSNGELVVPRSRVNTHPEDTIFREQTTIGYDLEHRFSDAWAVENRFRFFRSGYDYSPLNLPISFDESTGAYTRFPADQYGRNNEFAAQFNVKGDSHIAGLRNRIFAGVDLRSSHLEVVTKFDTDHPSILNFFDPDYGQIPDADALPAFPFNQDDEVKRHGIYAQDSLYLTDQVIVSGGIRYDNVRRDPESDTGKSQTDDAFVPQAGLVYLLTDTASLYGNYSESFVPSSVQDENGNALEPEEGRGFEAGSRLKFLDGKLASTIAFFHITKQNVATSDPDNALASVATGEQESRGAEIDLSGHLLPEWNVLASYGYTNAEVTEDLSIPVGNELGGIPKHTASLWTKYEFLSGALNGFGIGAGMQLIGDRYSDIQNTIELDRYTVVNAALSYKYDHWKAGLNFYNLLDEKYVQSASFGNGRGVYAGVPFNAIASLSWGF